MMQPFTVIKDTAQELLNQHDSPLYVYGSQWLTQRVELLREASANWPTTVRYAVKANPNTKIIRLFDANGLHFDASSEFEAEYLLEQGIESSKISLSSQQPPRDMDRMLKNGVQFVATSLHQLDLVTATGWQGDLAVRMNPGIGSGFNNRTTTGGISSSFGIWHEYTQKVLKREQQASWKLTRLHVHVGAGVDPSVWREVMKSALAIAEQFPNVSILDIGGGYKVARMPDEKEVDMHEVFKIFSDELHAFQESTGRKLALEIEPGSWLVANCGVLLSKIVDIVDTGQNGYTFLRLDTGMNDLLRPTLYGAQHPITVLNDATETKDFVVVGHNCESGDILTPAPGNPEIISPRMLNSAVIGDIVAIGGTGAYAASMRAEGYNQFPSAAEVCI
jgi:diaminopimelate decarboxylase